MSKSNVGVKRLPLIKAFAHFWTKTVTILIEVAFQCNLLINYDTGKTISYGPFVANHWLKTCQEKQKISGGVCAERKR